MKIKIVVMMSVILLAALPLSVSAWQPDSVVIGTWSGTAEIFAPFKKGEYPSPYPEDYMEIVITVDENGNVTGHVGDAVFTNCVVTKNRGWLCKKLNWRSDYIVTHGTLDGPIVPADQETKRDFTIPFNIVDGKLHGGFMLKEPWHYPYPMLPRLNLEKTTTSVAVSLKE
ncbi:MAG TPA: hypothetical protein PLP19_20660 [bacterium]|nr:hypothetical protein [bacterium]HPN45908.1 hypothetical protein [bacterium]